MTTWLPVPGYEGLYSVSDTGSVRNERTGYERKASFNKDGYLYLTLHKEGKRKHWFIHRLVNEAFNGPCPSGQMTRHLNGDKLDNRPENLAYGTHQQNVEDMLVHGTQHRQAQTHCIRGHEFDAKNTYIRPDGNRDCRACKGLRKTKEERAAYMREWRARKKLQAA